MSDLISRQAAISAIKEWGLLDGLSEGQAIEILADEEKVPSAEPETKPISYLDCANAMLMMWMDEVVTDGEYNRIMDKLNAHELKKRSKNG